jgi:hypothetical protein
LGLSPPLFIHFSSTQHFFSRLSSYNMLSHNLCLLYSASMFIHFSSIQMLLW